MTFPCPKKTRKSHRKLMSFRPFLGLNFEDEGAISKLLYLWKDVIPGPKNMPKLDIVCKESSESF